MKRQSRTPGTAALSGDANQLALLKLAALSPQGGTQRSSAHVTANVDKEREKSSLSPRGFLTISGLI